VFFRNIDESVWDDEGQTFDLADDGEMSVEEFEASMLKAAEAAEAAKEGTTGVADPSNFEFKVKNGFCGDCIADMRIHERQSGGFR